jgi:hypothetical protein
MNRAKLLRKCISFIYLTQSATNKPIYSHQLRNHTSNAFSPFSSTSFGSRSQLGSNRPAYLQQQHYEPPPPGELLERFGPGKTAMTIAFAATIGLFAYSSLDLSRNARKAVAIVDELHKNEMKAFLFGELTTTYYSELGVTPPSRPHQDQLRTQLHPELTASDA